jgi:hypothetical protein
MLIDENSKLTEENNNLKSDGILIKGKFEEHLEQTDKEIYELTKENQGL